MIAVGVGNREALAVPSELSNVTCQFIFKEIQFTIIFPQKELRSET